MLTDHDKHAVYEFRLFLFLIYRQIVQTVFCEFSYENTVVRQCFDAVDQKYSYMYVASFTCLYVYVSQVLN